MHTGVVYRLACLVSTTILAFCGVGNGNLHRRAHGTFYEQVRFFRRYFHLRDFLRTARWFDNRPDSQHNFLGIYCPNTSCFRTVYLEDQNLSFLEKVKTGGQTHSMELIILPLFILIFVGVIANNFSGSGIQTTPIFAANSSSPYPIGIVYPTTKSGCDVSVSNCNFSAISTFSFLNQNSPFTQLIQGNILGFFNCLISCPTSTQPISLIFLSGCTNFADSSADTNFIGSLYCLESSWSSATPRTFEFAPPYNATSNIGNNSNWYILPFPSQTNTVSNLFIYATYIPNGTVYSTKYCDAIKICYSTPDFTCPTIPDTPANLTNIQYCLVQEIVNGANGNTTFNNAFSFIGFLAAIIMIFLGFGLTFAATILGSGTTIGINSQATKMCQVFGIGLLAWSILYSEFGSWLNVFTLGLGTIVFTLLTITFFVGLYWRIFSLD